jgi:large subunit ribosomal protein L21
MTYAIVKLGGKQYRVQEGERITVDRVPHDENATFKPEVLFVGGDGEAELAPKVEVMARVVGHGRGPKIRIGKYRPKSGYRKHTGFRAATTEVVIESIGKKASRAKAATKADSDAPAEDKPKRTTKKTETKDGA